MLYYAGVREIGWRRGGSYFRVIVDRISDDGLIGIARWVNANHTDPPQLPWFPSNILNLASNLYFAYFLSHQHRFLFIGAFQIMMGLRISVVCSDVRLMMLRQEIRATEFLVAPLARIGLVCGMRSNMVSKISGFPVETTT